MTTLNTEIRSSFPRIIATGTGKDFPKLAESKVCRKLHGPTLGAFRGSDIATAPTRYGSGLPNGVGELRKGSEAGSNPAWPVLPDDPHPCIDARSKSFEAEVE